MMRRFAKPLLLMLCALFLFSSCASKKVAKEKEWKPGDIVICPYSGREFPLPEKFGNK